MIAEAGAAWAALETLANRAKTVKAIVDRFKDTEAKAAMLDLQEALLEAREKSFEDAALITELKRQIALTVEMKPDGDVFYRYPDEGEKEGPFCARCLQGENKNPVHLVPGGEHVQYQCPVCDRTAGWTKNPPEPPALPYY